MSFKKVIRLRKGSDEIWMKACFQFQIYGGLGLICVPYGRISLDYDTVWAYEVKGQVLS